VVDHTAQSDLSSAAAKNGIPAVRQRAREGKVRWTWPLVVCFIRLPLLLLGAALTYAFFALRGNSDAYAMTFAFSNFYLTFVNANTLFLLYRLCQDEGIRLVELIGVGREQLLQDVLLGLLWFFVLYIPFALGVMLVPLLVYDSGVFEQFQSIFAPPLDTTTTNLPLWLAWWGVVVFPLINAPTEELNYRGYAQQ